MVIKSDYTGKYSLIDDNKIICTTYSKELLDLIVDLLSKNIDKYENIKK